MIRVWIRLFIGIVEQDLKEISDSYAGLKVEILMEEKVYVEIQPEKRWLKFGNFVCKVRDEAIGEWSDWGGLVEEGKGEEDLWCSNLFTVCQRRRGFSDEKETKFK